MEEAVKRHILESFREKYHRAGKLTKGELLKEVQELMGSHRKHAIRAMRRRQPGRKAAGGKRGRKSRYEESAFQKALARRGMCLLYRMNIPIPNQQRKRLSRGKRWWKRKSLLIPIREKLFAQGYKLGQGINRRLRDKIRSVGKVENVCIT